MGKIEAEYFDLSFFVSYILYFSAMYRFYGLPMEEPVLYSISQ